MKGLESIARGRSIPVVLMIGLALIALAGCASQEARAVRSGDLAAIEDYIRSGGDVNAPQRGGKSLLMVAAEANQYESARLLVEHGAQINARDDRGRTALMYAAGSGDTPIASMLLAEQAEVNVRDSDGETALFYAARSGRQEIARLLLDSGADATIRAENGETALFVAVTENHYAVTEMLLQIGSDPNVRNNEDLTPIFGALDADHVSILDLLLSFGADATLRNHDGRTLLMIAAEEDNHEGLDLLLQTAPRLLNETDEDGWTAALIALSQSATSGSRLNRSANVLLRSGAQVAYRGEIPAEVAHAAAASGNVEVLSILLDAGMHRRLGTRAGDGVPDSDGIPLVITAIDQPDVIRRLVQARADLDAVDPGGKSALIVAAIDGNADAVQLLLQYRIRIDLADSGGRNALMYAAAAGHEDQVRTLLVAGAATWSRDVAGNTPVHFAAMSGTPQTVRILVTGGADINATNAAGQAPIDVAVSNPDAAEIIAILTDAGATQTNSLTTGEPVVIRGNGARLTGPDATGYDRRYISVPTGGVAEVTFRNEGDEMFSVHRVEADNPPVNVGEAEKSESVTLADEPVGNFFALRDQEGYDFAYYRVTEEPTQLVLVVR